ncbi:hypothetical protein BZA05DRAFT_331188 [Tricharina praecox]|uniref:uncharacterized protein n=1 Tax=Tricharina praecox TaxID=43433 RepID=UPI00222125CE|nr:uncharacterized protein BZA05DRAFT_331188 [Tricharina praecox]KAI5857565.1 hypothetical protein BZA05DRAFT_331188 [Tricharina praecox]
MNFLTLSLLLFPALALGVQLPPPTGPNKNIGTYTVTLTDSSRTSGFGGPDGVAREIVVQAFYPLPRAPRSGKYSDWAPPLTVRTIEISESLPNGTLSGITTNSFVQPASSPACPTKNLIPLVFSTGMGAPRAVYTTIYEQLASAGYFILAVDHPYDAIVVEYPEATKAPTYTALNLTSTDVMEVVESYLSTRVSDLRFLASQLKTLPCGRQLRTEKAGVFGHSLGGAASVGSLVPPTPFKAGINIDGFIFIYNTTSVAPAPVLILGAGEHNSSSDTSWAAFKGAQKGWVREAIVDGFQHMSFGDSPTVIEITGLADGWTDEMRAGLQEVFGTLSGERGREITGAYTEAFFNWALKGEKEGLVAENNRKFPEVTFI